MSFQRPDESDERIWGPEVIWALSQLCPVSVSWRGHSFFKKCLFMLCPVRKMWNVVCQTQVWSEGFSEELDVLKSGRVTGFRTPCCLEIERVWQGRGLSWVCEGQWESCFLGLMLTTIPTEWFRFKEWQCLDDVGGSYPHPRRKEASERGVQWGENIKMFIMGWTVTQFIYWCPNSNASEYDLIWK